MATWQSKLSKKELAHLRSQGITTLTVAKVNAEAQVKMRKKWAEEGLTGSQAEPCWECRQINIKLGLSV